MNILIVGGAGRVGSIIRPALEARYACYYYDLKPVPDAEGRTTVADINDEAALTKAMYGMQAVVNLAMGVRPGTVLDITDPDSAFAVNVLGSYRLLNAAMRAGVRRYVYASSLSVYERLQSARQIFDETVPSNAWNVYGLTKRLGEEVGRVAAERFAGAGIISLRLFAPTSEADWPEVNRTKPPRWTPLGPHDTRSAFIAAIERTATPGYLTVQVTGDLANEHFPNFYAAEVLGWKPEDR